MTKSLSKPSKWKDKYQYTANSNALRTILPQVVPYLVAKREQAELLPTYLSLVKPAGKARFQPRKELETIYSRLKVLNRKGRIPTAGGPRRANKG